MTREEAIKRLQGIQIGSDPETEHAEADDILCRLLTALGYSDVVAEWSKIDKWYASPVRQGDRV